MLYDCKRNKNKLFLHILLASSNSLLVLFASKITNQPTKTKRVRLDAQKLTFVCDDDFGVTCFYQKIIVLPI